MRKFNFLIIWAFILACCTHTNNRHIDVRYNSPETIQIEFTSYYFTSLVTILPDQKAFIINERGLPNYTKYDDNDDIKLLPDFKYIVLDSIKMNNIISFSKKLSDETPKDSLPIINGLIGSKYSLLANIIILDKDTCKFYTASIDYQNSTFSKSKYNIILEVLNNMIENTKDSILLEEYKFTKRVLTEKNHSFYQ